MLNGSPAYRLALPLSHKRVSTLRVRTLAGTVLAESIPIGGGSVTARLSSRVTRSASFTTSDEFFPVAETDIMHPAHAIAEIHSGIEYPSGEQELFQIFTGRVYRADRAANGEVTFRADDLAAEVIAMDFEVPMNSRPGSSCVAEIQRLISQTFEWATFGTNDVDDSRVPALTWDDDRGKACDDLASVVEGRWYALGNGDFVVRRYQYNDLTPVATLRDGEGGTLTSATTTATADGTANSVVVIAERVDGGTPINVIERNRNSLSPYRYGGQFGHRVLKIRSQEALTTADAQRVARSQLSAASALTRQWSLSCVPDMTLEPADVIGVDWRDVRDVQVIDSITYPLAVNTPMTISGRSSITVESVA